MKSIDISGQRFGSLLAMSVKSTGKKRLWLCRCDCGMEILATTCSLRAGQRISCGCARLGVDVGDVFGELTVISIGGRSRYGKGWRRLAECACSCGGRKSVFSHYLTRGTSTHCGCRTKANMSKAMRKPAGEALRNRVVASYIANARRKGLPVTISKGEMVSMFNMPCHYCGSPPCRVLTHVKHHGSFTYNGLDRLDAAGGYVEGNVVPCCSVCNYLKGDYTEREFLDIVNRISAHRMERAEALPT